jgi:hypothetical protein
MIDRLALFPYWIGTMSLKHLRTLLATASCFAAMTALGHGETYKTIPPLPKITVANFAESNEPFEFVTANAAGEKTFWAGKISVSKTGVITGSAMVERYDLNGAPVGKPARVTIQTGSRISTPVSPIAPTNSVFIDGDYQKEQRADYRADIIVKFSNGFVARGKITYEHSLYLTPNTSTTNGVTTIESWSGYNDSDEWTSISITGPKGHIGFTSDD